MRENVRYSLARAAKWAAFGLLGVVLIIIGIHFIIKRPGTVAPEAATVSEEAPAPGAAVDRKEGIEHVIFKGSRGKIKVKADRTFTGVDKREHLEGNVEVVDYGKTGGQELTVTAEKVDYDQKLTFFRISGRAAVRDKDSLFESPSFTYDKKRELVRTRRGVNFKSDRLDAKARELTYARRTEIVDLAKEVEITFRPRLETSLPVTVSGDQFTFRRKGRLGKMDGNVRMIHGRSRGSAESLTFVLSEDEQQIESVILSGSAVVTFFKESAGPDAPGQDIKADEIRMAASADGQALSRLKASGRCVIALVLESGGRDEAQAETAQIVFDPQGEMREFEADGSARMTLGGGTDSERRVRGNTISYAKAKEILQAEGSEASPARVDSGKTEIEATSVTVNQASGNMTASGGVKLVMKPAGDAGAVGFFAKDKPVFVTCQSLSYANRDKTFGLRKSVRIWQEKDVLLADRFDIEESSGAFSGRGGIKASFSHKPKDKPAEEERLEVAADEMDYLPRERRIAFAGACSLKTSALRMTSKSLDLRLAEGGSEMEGLQARGQVIILQEGKEGRGEAAVYDLDADTVVLTGNPVLVDKEKGVTQGDKLTFHLGDGRITIENQERDRSATIIKS